MSQAAAGGFNLGYESAKHPSNDKAGKVVGSGAIADMVQARGAKRRECRSGNRRDFESYRRHHEILTL